MNEIPYGVYFVFKYETIVNHMRAKGGYISWNSRVYKPIGLRLS